MSCIKRVVDYIKDKDKEEKENQKRQKEKNWCVKQVKRFDEIKVLKIRHKAVLYLIAFIQFCVP